ncbi:TPR domain-containing protein, putative [Eimeria necatrix]|uniref:TPR domain-containing protein, putative n=1 Tax=Eimeria necatrix TaxID=51315 RepID=U6MVS7_9EIME|nr:TPR domain-containing protein, putative [Eimeria necatrix]CDJ67103.1 TPR domain-containing protein, putative [Eimeria necatrix]
MGNSSSSVAQPPVLGSELTTPSLQSQSRSYDDSCKYLVTGPRPQGTRVTDAYTLDVSSDAGLCCGSAPTNGSVSFVSREEALIKARYYKDRNPELAKQAYLFALNSPPTKGFGKTQRLEVANPATNCGCSFVRCTIPQPVSACWASSQFSHPEAPEGMPDVSLQKMASAEATSTTFSSGNVTRLHTDDLDELVVSNPAAQRLQVGDVSGRTTGRESLRQLDDSEFRAEIHAELAQLHLICGEPRKALECYNSAELLAPEQLAYSYRKGVVLQQLGEREGAISCFRAVLQNDSKYKPAIFNLGVCLAVDPATRSEALGTFEHLLSIDPNNDSALDMIADIHEQEGRVAEAYTVKQRVVTLDPSNFRAGRDLARLESTLLDRGGVPGYVTLN